MTDFQVHRMAKTKSSPCVRSPDELLAEGTKGASCSTPPQTNPEAEVASTGSSASSRLVQLLLWAFINELVLREGVHELLLL